jgi:hypothetical protein
MNRGKKENQQQTMAPGPVVDPIGTPKSPIVDPGAQQAAATQAAVKVRKRAAVGSMLTQPKAPKSSVAPVAPRLARASLLGS